MMKKTLKFIDLFAGIGGTRIGLESALKKAGFDSECVFTSEIKDHAISVYSKNFNEKNIYGDITKIKEEDIPDFDILLAGFPCQPFSSAGVRRGFTDTRGTLFFDIERILKNKKPMGFLLENVEGLKTHDRQDSKKEIGKTLEVILERLNSLGYKTNWKIINASDHGTPQSRKRIYIVGTLKSEVNLDDIPHKKSKLSDILEKNVPDDFYIKTEFTKKLLENYNYIDLWGKQIKDKRGGPNNIHSWDLGIKGKIKKEQRELLEELLRQRRRKSWARQKNIKWMDGMPLTLEEINSFYTIPKNSCFKNTKNLLEDLVQKGYIVKEIPKSAHEGYAQEGYNIVTGKLSFEISHILDPNICTPTLVATDVTRLALADKKGIRRLTIREGLRLFGFPEKYKMEDDIKYNKAFDLLGNSVCVNVIEKVSERLIKALN